MSALLTDTIRAMLLEDMGYSVDMIEFVDFEHSPKNLMIRAKKTKPVSHANCAVVGKMLEQYSMHQTLFELIKKDFGV